VRSFVACQARIFSRGYVDSTSAVPCFKIDNVERGLFITFEGSEACGKSTQARRLATRLQKVAVPYLLTREPGGTPIGESIRELLQFAPQSTDMSPVTELLLFEASRSQLVREVIKPALARGTCVISDRFFDSTTVYQGAARKLDRPFVEELNLFVVEGCIPDITFVLDIDPKTAQSRMQSPRRPDRMEREAPEFYERVQAGYRELAAREAKRVVLIDGAQSADEVEAEIWNVLSTRFPALGKKSNIKPQTSKI
jgi:dTMP kinase